MARETSAVRRGLLSASQRRDAVDRVVAEEARAHLVQEAGVDLVDDLQVPRQDRAEHLERPALQRLGQQRVVGVGEGLPRYLPGLVPAQAVLVEQQAHQLGDRDRGMGIAELHRELLLPARDRDALDPQDALHVLQRA